MLFNDLCLFLDNHRIRYIKEAKIAPYVSIRVGGIASIIAFPDNAEKFCCLLNFVYGKIKYFILGNGTNCYFADYFDGIIIATKYLNNINADESELCAECGALMTSCSAYAYNHSLGGIEFLYGIPGSIGGGVYMNASAFGSMISDFIKECTAFDASKNTIVTMKNAEMQFGNKKSVFMNGDLVIIKAVFSLHYEAKEIISNKIIEFTKKRINSQPLDFPNAGSAFKRPKNDYASRLIDMAGLKGYSVGDAEISVKHAGFIINKGRATANEINELIRVVKETVKNKFFVELEEEIIFVE